MQSEIAGVSDVTNYLVTNYINVPAGFSISLTARESQEAGYPSIFFC